MKRAVSFRLDAELLDRMAARARELGQTQTLFVERALEAALSGGDVSAPQGADVRAARSLPAASPRAHESKPDEVALPKIAKRKW